jgi:O-antigen ligase
VVFLFSVFTGLPQLIPHIEVVRPILVIGGLGLIVLFVTGRFMTVLMTPIGKALAAFTIWFIICIPLAIWHGGSFGVFVQDWSKSFLGFVLTAGLITTLGQCKRAFNTIAYAVGLLALFALRFHDISPEGRLELAGRGRFGNANDLAWTLLVGLAFLGYLYMRGGGLKKVTAVILILPVLVAIAKTGSRAGVLGAAMLALYVFFQSSAAVRMRLIIFVPVLFVVLVLVIPARLRDRYTTFFRPKNDQSVTRTEIDAIGSAEARLKLLEDSLLITAMHPFFGVGPGNFMVEQDNLAKARGERKGLWHVTHNTYTQLSSEMGIPGLVIYLVFLFGVWRVLTSIIRRKVLSSDLRLMAQTLRAVFLVVVLVAIFDSYAYDINIPVLAGLVTALSLIARAQVTAKKARDQDAEMPVPSPEAALEPVWNGPPY